MTPHTPGPWTTTSGDRAYVGILADGVMFAYVVDGVVARPEMEANARLIAAAPTMLAALERYTSAAERNEITLGAIEQARAAIAQATGEH